MLICGLVGMAGNFYQADLKFFRQALFADTFRGAHSTGMFQVDSKNACTYLKTTDAGPDFIKIPSFKPTITDKVMAGHNRYATQGAHTQENAHPFHHGNVVLMHNGTLDTRKGLATDKRFTVDSEHIAYTIGNCESDDEIIDVLEQLDGAFALVWYNVDTDVLYICRNKERSLAMAKTKDTIYWASEKKMLDWILDRNNILVEDIEKFPTGVVMKVDMSASKTVTSDNVETLEFTPAERFPRNYYGYGRGYGGSSYSSAYSGPVETMQDWGYTYGEFLEFKATSFVPHIHNNGMLGNLFGVDEETGRPIVIYSVEASELTFTDGHLDTDLCYASVVQGMSRPTVNRVSQNYHLTLSSKELFMWDENYAADYTEEEDDPASEITHIIGGKRLDADDLKELRNKGCAMCGDPITDVHYTTVVWDDDGHPYHSRYCLEEAEAILRSYNVH